jgi:hypothetical protein
MSEIALNDLMTILRESKEDNCLKEIEGRLDEVLEILGAQKQESGFWEINRSLRIAVALHAVSRGADIEDVVNMLTWKDFEGFVANILMENNYQCVESFRKRGTPEARGFEIDVIGIKENSIVAIDAKMWGVRKGKSSALKPAAEKQKERTKRLCRIMGRLSERMGTIPNGTYSLKPILVTWVVEEVVFHGGVPIVPVFKLNSFLQDIAIYEDMIATSKCVFGG